MKPQLNDLRQRLKRQRLGRWDVTTRLRHFALINYAVPPDRLLPHIPTERFELDTVRIGGEQRALFSVVPFVDRDFHFPGIAPFAKFQFAQTNQRIYITDKTNGEKCVWFLGTSLGSPVVYIPRILWRMPWSYARFEVDCRYNKSLSRYTHWQFKARSSWCDLEFDIEDTGTRISEVNGFETLEDFYLRITHPVTGYYHRLDGTLGSYSIWHNSMDRLTVGVVKKAWISLYDRLGVLSREEMQEPHSVFLLPQVRFDVYLPPRPVC